MRQTYPISSKVLVTAPPREPISLDEAKLHLRVDGNDEDTVIGALITIAREWVESDTSLALAPQTWDFFWGQFPGIPPYQDADEIVFPTAPVTAVTQLDYTTSAGTVISWSVSGSNLNNPFGQLNAHVDTSTLPQRIRLAYSTVWPNEVLRTVNGVRIRATAGYPSWSGIVTKAGNALVKTSGDNFDPTWTAGKRILINGTAALIVSVADGSNLTIAPSSLADGSSLAYAADSIPEMLRAALKLLIGHLYDNREAVTDGIAVIGTKLPMGVDTILIKRKLWSFA